MQWPDYFPEDCPPEDAEGALGEIYRFVPSNKSYEYGFTCQKVLFGIEDNDEYECLKCGLSVGRSYEECLRKKKLVPSLSKKVILYAHLEQITGKLKKTLKEKDKDHHTWWIPEDIENPWDYFKLID